MKVVPEEINFSGARTGGRRISAPLVELRGRTDFPGARTQ